MSSVAPASSNTPSRRTYSCVRCYDRKVKCDKQHPICKHCARHNAECMYRPPPPSSRRSRKQPQASTVQSDSSTKEPNVLPPTPVSTSSEQRIPVSKTQLVTSHDRSKFVDNPLWTRVVEEIQDPEQVLEEGSSDTSDSEASDGDYGFAIGIAPKRNKRQPHPSSEHAQQLWQIFVTNIDPMIKVIHVPTLNKAVQKAVDNPQDVPKSFEALLFAIYSTAVVSLRNDECKKKFGEPREVLLSRFNSATREALARAKFLGSVSFVVLQALVLHLLALRDIIEPRALWTLTGVAIRLAESMGVHLDGEALGLPPFETEIRRRVWWHLKLWDFRVADLCGLPKFRDTDSPTNACKKPANLNDNQLFTGMSSPPIESQKITDMVFVNSRIEFFSHATKESAKLRDFANGRTPVTDRELNVGITEKFIKDSEEMLESNFIRYCDPSQPLELMSMHCARSVLNMARFLAHHPRSWATLEEIPETERQYVWGVSVKLLEGYDIMHSTRQLQKFAWNIPYPWHILIHVLDTLRASPLMSEADHGWELVECMYENNPEMTSNTKKAVYVAIGNLCLEAFDARKAALSDQESTNLQTPDFVSKLRSQREAAKARRTARVEAKQALKRAASNHSNNNGSRMSLSPNAAIQRVDSESTASTLLPRAPVLNYEPFNTTVKDQSYRSSNIFDHLLGTSAADIMNVDIDFMLAQDNSFENNQSQSINWSQWDAWVGDMNVMPTNIGVSTGWGNGNM